MGKYFGTDGVRGQANTDLTLDMAVRIGQYLGWYYGQNGTQARILIGKDTRLSGDMLELGLAAGAISTGAHVWLLGVCPTPAVSFLIRDKGFDCGIMVSASHNPYTDNGIKIFNHEGKKMPEDVLLEIEKCMDHEIDVPAATGEKVGTCTPWHEGLQIYIDWLEETVPLDLAGMKIAVDLANGSAVSTAVKTLTDMGADVHELAGDPNGININYHCGSTHPEALKEFVVEEDCDLGLAFDGDADRLIAVAADGTEINGDYILYMIGRHMKEQGKLNKNMVVTTVMANLGLYKGLQASGIDYIQTPVGDKYVFEEMEKNDYRIGGEQSGHIIFYEHMVTGDGLLTALKLLETLKDSGKTIPELSEGLFIYPQLLVNVHVKDKKTVLDDAGLQKVLDDVNEKLAGNGRILVRPSGTEPLIRVMVEAQTDALCAQYVKEVTDYIESRNF